MERFRPVKAGESADPEINRILQEAKTGVWADPNLFGMIAHRPAFLKAMNPVFHAIFHTGSVPAYLKDLMRIATGHEWGCEY
jgi:hypothetical protein